MPTFTPHTPPPHERLIDEMADQGTLPQSRIQEETITVSDQGAVTLRFDGEFRHLHVYLGEEGMALDAEALDKLIALLSAKRARMVE